MGSDSRKMLRAEKAPFSGTGERIVAKTAVHGVASPGSKEVTPESTFPHITCDGLAHMSVIR